MQRIKWLLMVILVMLIQVPALAWMAPSETALSHWEYRWDGSQGHVGGIPAWALDDSSKGWQPCPEKRKTLLRPPVVTTLWLRTRMPAATVQSPCLYFEGIYDTALIAENYEIYLGKELLSRASEKAWKVSGKLSVFESTVVPLPTGYSGKMLTIRLMAKSQPLLGLNGKVQVASYRGTLRTVLRRDIDVLILGFFFCVLALLLFLGGWLYRGWIGAFSLGAFCLCMGLISITAYNNTSLIFPNFQAWLLLNTLSTLFAPVTFAKFFEHFFGDRPLHLVRRVWQTNLAIASAILLLLGSTILFHGAFHWLFSLSVTVYLAVIILDVLILYAIAIFHAVHGDPEGRFFTVGFTLLVLFVGAFMVDFFFISHPFSHPSLLAWGTLFFILSLIYLLGWRFVENHKRLEAQHGALNRMWLEVKNSRDAIATLNADLERRVEERAEQLETANAKLTNSLATLQETQTHLIQSEKMAALGNLVAGIAHEVNTPVGIGVTAASMLEEKTRQFEELFQSGALKKSEFERYLETAIENTTMILANLERAASLMNSFRQVATDQSTEASRRFKVKEYLEEVLLSLRPHLKRTRHQITIDCDPDLEITSFPGAISQILTNLIMNSLVHGFEEKPEGHIRIQVSLEGHSIVMSYEDDGKGIPHWNLPRIFDPFFTTRRGQGGTGLGLNIVFNLAHHTLGGSIECDSVIGHGARFTLRIPLLEEPTHE